MSSRREIRRMGTLAKIERIEGRRTCAAEAAEKRDKAAGECHSKRQDEADARQKRSAAWGRARSAGKSERRACEDAARRAAAQAPKGKRRAAGARLRKGCAAQGRSARKRATAEYRRERASHEAAVAERRTVCVSARGVRRAAFAACAAKVDERHERERRKLDRLEEERRRDAKKRRGGRRPPVSPAERDQEEIGRAAADLEAYPRGARALFERRPYWYLRAWKRARAEGRRLSLAEFVGHQAEEDQDAVQEAEEAAVEATVDEWIKDMERKWRRAA